MARTYRQARRAEAQEETRERIVRATMALHDEQGVAATTVTDIAQRAGVGAATVLRHYPSIGDLVNACGAHVAAEMRPPAPDQAEALFEGLDTPSERLERLAEELDAFYTRGAMRLIIAGRDRARIPELDQFLAFVDMGIAAMIRAALGPQANARAVEALIALCDVAPWSRLEAAGWDAHARRSLLTRLFRQALAWADERQTE